MRRTPAILIERFPERNAAVRAAVERWSGDLESIEHVSDGASFTYRFTSSGRRFFLRLMPPGWRSRAEVEGEVAYIEHLHGKGLPVARPVASADGGFIEAVDSELGQCLAVAYEAVAGDAEDDVHWSPEQADEAGRLMARMHDAARDLVLPAGASRPSWRDELRSVTAELAPQEIELRAILSRAELLLERLPVTPDVFGMVHFDLSGDNVVWQGLSPVAIDFDDCLYHWHTADLARTIAYFREQAHGGVSDQEAAMLDGYRAVRPIAEDWLRLFPFFLRIALISELAWMTYASRVPSSTLRFTAADEENLRNIIAGLDGALEA